MWFYWRRIHYIVGKAKVEDTPPVPFGTDHPFGPSWSTLVKKSKRLYRKFKIYIKAIQYSLFTSRSFNCLFLLPAHLIAYFTLSSLLAATILKYHPCAISHSQVFDTSSPLTRRVSPLANATSRVSCRNVISGRQVGGSLM